MRIIKPFCIALLILASLFTAGAMNCRTITHLNDSIDTQLHLSQAAAENGRWDEVEQSLAQMDNTWQDHEAYLHVVLDHNEIDETESLYAEMCQYARQQDSNKYCTSAARLSVQLNHMKNTQQLSLKNIF